MPGGDRTGPRGLGPMTGRGIGSCYDPQPGGRFSTGYGRTGAFGVGRGRGWRNRYYATGVPGWAAQQPGAERELAPGYLRGSSDQDELGYSKDYSARIEDELNSLRARMAELEKTMTTG